MKKTILLVLIALLPLTGYSPGERIDRPVEEEKSPQQIAFEEETERILWTIKIVESNGNMNAIGGSGEIGWYQFMPDTWNKTSMFYFGEILDIKNPDHQDKVARAKVQHLMLKGYDFRQIASKWNSGSPEWKGKIGINRFGQHYNVPHHVAKFENVYFSYKLLANK